MKDFFKKGNVVLMSSAVFLESTFPVLNTNAMDPSPKKNSEKDKKESSWLGKVIDWFFESDNENNVEKNNHVNNIKENNAEARHNNVLNNDDDSSDDEVILQSYRDIKENNIQDRNNINNNMNQINNNIFNNNVNNNINNMNNNNFNNNVNNNMNSINNNNFNNNVNNNMNMSGINSMSHGTLSASSMVSDIIKWEKLEENSKDYKFFKSQESLEFGNPDYYQLAVYHSLLKKKMSENLNVSNKNNAEQNNRISGHPLPNNVLNNLYFINQMNMANQLNIMRNMSQNRNSMNNNMNQINNDIFNININNNMKMMK